jgi:hypothetical protein
MTAGRPPGHVRLMDDPDRFEVAAWHAFTEAGLGPYPAAYLVTFLLSSHAPITTESIDDVLLLSSVKRSPMVALTSQAEWVRRKSPEAIERADDAEREWVVRSSALILGLVKFVPRLPETQLGVEFTLDCLKREGWAEPILRVTNRIGASLRSNFPPPEGLLSRTAKRVLRDLLKK